MFTLIEQPSVTEAVEGAESKWKRASDAWNAVTWVIAHDPTIGKAVTESGRTRLLVFDGARSIDMPTVRVTYEIGNPDIILHEAIFEDASFQQAGRA